MTRLQLGTAAGGGIALLTAVLLLAASEPDYSRIPVQTLDDLTRELERMRERFDIPGLAAAVAIDGRLLWSHGFGRADLERGTRVDAETTSFHLASVTKPYAATVVLQLADEGRLRLDAPVSEFGIQLTRSEPVRVWHLLSHTSGEPPGHVYRYDARAFGHLTTVVERVTARPFAAELTDRIVRKLELKHTGPNPREVDLTACRAQAVRRVMGLVARRHLRADATGAASDRAVRERRIGRIGSRRRAFFRRARSGPAAERINAVARVHARHRLCGAPASVRPRLVRSERSRALDRVAVWTGIRELVVGRQDPATPDDICRAREFGWPESQAPARRPWRRPEVTSSKPLSDLVSEQRTAVVPRSQHDPT